MVSHPVLFPRTPGRVTDRVRGRNTAALGTSPEGTNRQRDPSRNETETANRRDRAQPTDPRDRKQIEAPGKDRDPGHKQPAGRPGPGVRPPRGRPSHRQQAKRVGQVIPDSGLVHCQHVGCESIAEAVRAERPQQHPKPTQRRPRREPSCHHDSVSYRGRASRGSYSLPAWRLLPCLPGLKPLAFPRGVTVPRSSALARARLGRRQRGVRGRSNLD